MQWDLFCRVIDNFGDIGVCGRLAADLATRGHPVRLFVDDARALAWMAPEGAAGVEVHAWPAGDDVPAPGDVAVEAFGCELPVAYVARMAAATRAPAWLNLEYLTAEAYAERSHKLASPQHHGPGAGLRKWFFYPGFSAASGGLLREPGLAARQRAFEPRAWLDARGATPRPGERLVSLFCYDAPALPALVDRLAAEPTVLLATAGPALRQVLDLLGPTLRRGRLRAFPVAALSQVEYDHLLWACDLNFVRGEDSFVRAQWAGKPFVWQIYPQDDGAHHRKLDAFLALHGAGEAVAAFWRAWNGTGGTLPAWPAEAPWLQASLRWREHLWSQSDLTTRMLDFVNETK